MAGGVFSGAKLNAMTIRESANDGSDFTNPDADYRRLFLGEDGSLHFKDSAGAVTSAAADLAGKELDYVEVTSATSITATSEATGINIVSGSSVAYDGATIVLVEFYCPQVSIVSTGAGIMVIDLWEDSTAIGRLAALATGATSTDWRASVLAARRLTPSNASHTYHVKAWKTAAGPTVSAGAGAGGTGALMPAFIRITRVSS